MVLLEDYHRLWQLQSRVCKLIYVKYDFCSTPWKENLKTLFSMSLQAYEFEIGLDVIRVALRSSTLAN